MLGQCDRQRARSRACVDNQRPRRQRLRGGPGQNGFGLRTRYKHTRADMQHHGPKRHSPDEMLQRHPPRTSGDDVAIAPEELVAGRLEQG
ncbi:Uncharacterised protein [Mycobacterium tuberculosis]|nr:Uncharacterised protein [Mycobacterium tuberculosis]